MTDMFSIFTEVDEQKIGIAVEPIPGKMVFISGKLCLRRVRYAPSDKKLLLRF
jgi:hypothetical protein